MSSIDLETTSQPFWKNFVKSLTPNQQSALDIWRGGAVWTPTRRYYTPGANPLRRCPRKPPAPIILPCPSQSPSALMGAYVVSTTGANRSTLIDETRKAREQQEFVNPTADRRTPFT